MARSSPLISCFHRLRGQRCTLFVACKMRRYAYPSQQGCTTQRPMGAMLALPGSCLQLSSACLCSSSSPFLKVVISELSTKAWVSSRDMDWKALSAATRHRCNLLRRLLVHRWNCSRGISHSQPDARSFRSRAGLVGARPGNPLMQRGAPPADDTHLLGVWGQPWVSSKVQADSLAGHRLCLHVSLSQWT